MRGFYSRRGLAAALFATFATDRLAQAATRAKIVTLLGDSITAGLGLPATQALPAQLQAALRAQGWTVLVRGAGVSGDTSAGGLERVDFSVAADTDVCVVALGGNDLLQGLEPKITRANLQAIVRRLKARRIAVVLAGLRAPPLMGGAYAREFDAVYPAVSRANGVGLVSDLLAGVAGHRALNQGDGLHPNAAGARIVAAHLAPAVARALGGAHKARR